MDVTDRLKRLYSKGDFANGFVQAAKDDLPMMWGRMNLLEEFYDLNAPGFSDRSKRVSDQLGKPVKRWRPGGFHPIRTLIGIFR